MSIFRESLFSDRVALVTGGGTGVGRGIAEALARHGADVAIVSRKPEHLNAASESIVAATGRRCLAITADVRQPEAVDSAESTICMCEGTILRSVGASSG